MNFILHKHNKELDSAEIPDGLEELLADISREVLRSQPSNVYEFIADYLDAMLMTREHANIAKRNIDYVADICMVISDVLDTAGFNRDMSFKIVGVVQSTLESCVKNMNECKMSKNEQSSIIEKDILTKVIDQISFTPEEAEKLKDVVQVCFKNYYFREKDFEIDLTKLPTHHWVNRAEKTLEIYKRSNPERWELERAATIIQAAYRGYYSRKLPAELQKMNTAAIFIQSQRMEMDEEFAACKIQATFKGYTTRKKLNKRRDEELAACKIQATFKGYTTRKNFNKKKESGIDNAIVQDSISESSNQH